MSSALSAAATEPVCRALGRRLAECSGAPLFGLAGSANLEIIAAFREAGGTYHAARHEAGAVAMADGWAQVSGETGLVTLHQGPGLANALTALVDAAKERTPLLVIAGEAAAPGAQWFDQAATLAALGVPLAVHRLTADTDPAELVAKARRDRRPIVLLAPAGVQAQPARRRGPDVPRPPASPSPAPEPDAGAVSRLAARLSRARRPVILAGRGAALAGAGPLLRELGERTGALLATTAPAHGLFAGEPFAVGIAGGFASPLATRLLGRADLVLVAGASLGPWTTCDGRLFDAAVVERIDLDARAGVAVAGDVARVAAALLEQVPRRTGWRTPELAAELAAYDRRAELPASGETGGRVHPGVLWVELERRLPARRCVVLDSGHFMAWPSMLAEAAGPGTFLFGQAFQAVGLGLPRAVGAALARPDRLTVAVIGDGGAMMALGEIDTVVRAGAPLLVVVFDDAAYGAEVHDFAPLGVPVDAARFPDRDLAAIARAIGCDGVTVRRIADLDAVVRWCARPRGPLLVDAKVDPRIDATTLMTPLGAAGWSPAPRPNEGPQR